jgi:Fungal chitosanase of glycosyl hydrolase group 75
MLVVLLATTIFAVILYRWISEERLQFFPSREAGPTSPTPEPTPTRPPPIGGKLDTGRLFSGITLHSSVETTPGADATTERVDPESYVLDLKLNARVPTPNRTLEELAKVTPRLPELLPGLNAMFGPEPVSPLFTELYNTKIKMLHENLSRLDLLLSRHNFFDCQTVLQLQHPQSHRKALLLQADMDVDADGSDGDRMPVGTGAPTNFKPFTSFKWPKKTAAPNPYLAGTEERLKRAEDEFNARTTTAERKRDLRNVITQLRAEVVTLQKYSFLIGMTDPYIVIPGSFTHGRDAAKTGDYSVVIFGDAIYPAIVGDIGPNDKVGEASFRIGKQINPLTTPYNRPVSDLKVTYLIFPGTADPQFGPPDLEKLSTRCQQLIEEIGGATVPLYHWENIIPPPPTPTPTPTATPSASPSAATSATGSSSPSAAPSATFAFPLPSPSLTR